MFFCSFDIYIRVMRAKSIISLTYIIAFRERLRPELRLCSKFRRSCIYHRFNSCFHNLKTCYDNGHVLSAPELKLLNN